MSNYPRAKTVIECPLCKREAFETTTRHALFKQNINKCISCEYAYFTFSNDADANKKSVQKDNSNSFGMNKARNEYYVKLFKKIDNRIDLSGIIEIGTPKDFNFLKRIHETRKDVDIYSHDILENNFPEYIKFSTSLDFFRHKQIDLLFCIHTLEHIPIDELVEFVKFCKNVFKFFIFEVPCCETEIRIQQSTTQPHYSFFTEKSIRRLFGDSIEVEKTEKILKFNNLPFKLYGKE